MKFPQFGKKEYAAPQVSSVPEGQGSDMSGTFINEGQRQILVKLCDGGKPEDLQMALGTLEIAKDIVKQTLTAWHQKDARTKGLIKVTGNGHG